MNKILKILKTIGIIIWATIAVFVTVCLISYNEFNISVLGRNTLLIIDNDELEPSFVDGDLVIVKRDSDKKINVGDKVFFYNGNKAKEFLINVGEVTDKEDVTSTETTYEIDGKPISGSYVIGKTDSTKTYHHLGLFLGILLSQWGFMFLIILPTLFALVYEIIIIVEEAKKVRKASLTKE